MLLVQSVPLSLWHKENGLSSSKVYVGPLKDSVKKFPLIPCRVSHATLQHSHQWAAERKALGLLCLRWAEMNWALQVSVEQRNPSELLPQTDRGWYHQQNHPSYQYKILILWTAAIRSLFSPASPEQASEVGRSEWKDISFSSAREQLSEQSFSAVPRLEWLQAQGTPCCQPWHLAGFQHYLLLFLNPQPVETNENTLL